MRVLYIAPRYHTNQVPIIRGWIESGDFVKFISQYRGTTEDYSYMQPDILGYSTLFKGINWIYTHVINKKIKYSANIFAFEMKYGIPPVFQLNNKIREFKPDIVILRERSIYNMVAYFVCRLNKLPTILYNQTPLWNEEPIKNDILHKIVRKCTPPKRISPVLGKQTAKSYKEENSYFIPFVAQTKFVFSEKKYFRESKINLLSVAKYETRKNLLMLLEIVKEIRNDFEITMTIVGEVSTNHHREYYHRVESYVSENGLSDIVKLIQNVTMKDVELEYEKADVFVLPSTKEVASVSQLEAMAYALPVICSNTNGAACYIEDGKNGLLFSDNSKVDLKKKLISLIINKESIYEMGKCSYHKVETQYSFTKYKQRIKELI